MNMMSIRKVQGTPQKNLNFSRALLVKLDCKKALTWTSGVSWPWSISTYCKPNLCLMRENEKVLQNYRGWLQSNNRLSTSVWCLVSEKCSAELKKVTPNLFILRLRLSYFCTLFSHGVLDFEFGRKKLSRQVTTDSDTVFREESIGEGFKIVTVAVFEKILLFE